MNNKVYIIEDDVALREELARILTLQGYGVDCCTTFRAAAADALHAQCDAVVLDLHLPENDGLSICREIRTKSSVPILVLTSSDVEFDEIMSMKVGADDYITKPYSPAVLLAHIERLIERSGGGACTVLRYADMELDVARSVVQRAGTSVELSRNEARILAALMKAAGGIVSRQELMYELWQSDEFIDDNTLTVNVNRLRKALERLDGADSLLKTHRGQGYSL